MQAVLMRLERYRDLLGEQKMFFTADEEPRII